MPFFNTTCIFVQNLVRYIFTHCSVAESSNCKLWHFQQKLSQALWQNGCFRCRHSKCQRDSEKWPLKTKLRLKTLCKTVYCGPFNNIYVRNCCISYTLYVVYTFGVIIVVLYQIYATRHCNSNWHQVEHLNPKAFKNSTAITNNRVYGLKYILPTSLNWDPVLFCG